MTEQITRCDECRYFQLRDHIEPMSRPGWGRFPSYWMVTITRGFCVQSPAKVERHPDDQPCRYGVRLEEASEGATP